MFAKLEEVEKRFEQLGNDLQNPSLADDQNRYRRLMKEYADLEVTVETFRNYKKTNSEIESHKHLLSTETDEDLRDLIKDELPGLQQLKESLEHQLQVLMLPNDPRDAKDVIFEIRAGAGGDEASLFSEELFRAYTLYAQGKGWSVSVLSVSDGNAGGYKEVVASISGDRVYSHLKYESGVHRVQRVPKTETQGRVHTSTVTVAVVPEADDVDIKINPSELRIDTMRASGSGGQHINTTDSAVRITHLPTGLAVYCQQERSQLKNKDKAMKMLQSKLLAAEEEKREQEASAERLSQIGTGDRSERIRTYNFPQSRLSDHRIGLTIHSLQAVMSGEMAPVIDAVRSHFLAEAIKASQETR